MYLIGAFLDDADFVDQQAVLPAQTIPLSNTSNCTKHTRCKQGVTELDSIPIQTFVFGKESDGDPGFNVGSAYVFTQVSENQWIQSDKLTGNNSEGGDLFGYQLAIENDIAVISAPGRDDHDELAAGAVYIYKRSGSSDSEWQQIQFLTASDGKLDDHFGQSVGINNKTIAIGATQKDVGAQNTGIVYIFRPNNSANHWTEIAQLTAPNPSAQSQFGHKLAIQDNLLLVSAYNERNSNSGTVYLFKHDDAQQTDSGWIYADEFSAPSNSPEQIGASIAFNSDSLAIGAVDSNGSGKVFVSSNSSQPTQGQLPPVLTPSTLIPDSGLWWNPQRSGHGLDIQLIGDNLLVLWYTYRDDGSPVWYLASAPFSGSSRNWSADLGLYHWDGEKASHTSTDTLQITFSDESHGDLSWTIDGQSGTQSIVPFITSSQPSANDFNGTWYEPDKPGYGLTASIQGNNEISVVYFYDNNGAPVWVLGSYSDPQLHTYAVNTYRGSCPSCPYTPPVSTQAGTIATQFSSPASGRLSTDIELQTPLAGDWIVNDVAIDNLAWNLSVEQGALNIPSQAVFDRLANTSRSVGTTGTPEVKFLMTDVNTDSPQLYFINTKTGNEGTYHYDFARDVLKQYTQQSYRRGQGQFSAQAYFSDQRLYLPGSIVAYNSFQSDTSSSSSEIYSIEFWPTDPVSFRLVNLAYQAISKAMPFLNDRLFYHPVGETHEQLYFNNQGNYDAVLKSILTDNLLARTTRSVLNEGEAYGRLRIINQSDPPPSLQDIAIYRFIPNDLSHIAGIITETPQTPLSHINLKARQNNTPNTYINNASEDAEIKPLIGQWVHYQANDNRITITSSTQQQAEQWLQQSRPTNPQIPGADLSVSIPQKLADIGYLDWISFGVKAANVAELAKILPDGMVPDGYAIPFAIYDQFMRLPRCGKDLTDLCEKGVNGTSFYQQATTMLADHEFQSDLQVREQQLKAFRKSIKQAQSPVPMTETVEAIRLFWEPDGTPFSQSLRVRSSTNNEDLPKFNGAGLYSSFTHKQDEGKLIESVKQVWASLWNSRAFDEREFYRIDHFKTYMGVLVHPNFGDEQANGVSLSKNIYNPNWQGIYTNVQHGEISITNPEPIDTDSGQVTPIPDEFVTTRLAVSSLDYDWETQFIRHTNVKQVYGEPAPVGNVLTDAEILELRDTMLTIHRHFKIVYQGGDDFAMETEFKITETTDGSRGRLAIKQARPWVE